MKLFNLLFPPRCVGCCTFLSFASSVSWLCPVCEGKWPRTDYLLQPSPGQRVSAVGPYEGLLKDLIVRFKYQREEGLARFLGGRMAEIVPQVSNTDLIVPIPLHRRRLRERGFNQSLLLAREVGRARRIPINPFLLVKVRPTPPQTGLQGKERRENLRRAFALRRDQKVEKKKILLVDDVYTTGATIEEVTGILLKGGAERVESVVLARA